MLSRLDQQIRRLRDPDVDLGATLRNLGNADVDRILRSWAYQARDEQLPPPGDWMIWLLLAARSSGKTRACAETTRMQAMRPESCAGRLALVGATVADVRDTMIQGESGLEAACDRAKVRYKYTPSRRRFEFLDSGTVAFTYSADAAGRLRGPQHGGAWADEIREWDNIEAWDNLMMGLRLGPAPWCIASSTPRPNKLIRDLVKDPTCVVRSMTTYANRANLPEKYFKKTISRYEGTRWGRQEIYAEILDDDDAVLVTWDVLEKLRRKRPPEMDRIVVAVDPAITANEDSDEVGILVCGRDSGGDDGRGYVLEDCSVHRCQPKQWARVVIDAFRRWQADCVVAEINQGGDLVESTLVAVDGSIPFEGVWATRGKKTRAEPIGALYDRGRIHHCGIFHDLEKQLTEWLPGMESPDRLDALVHGMTHLLIGDEDGAGPLDFYT